MEESCWRQKASFKWKLEGDRNTKLFHNIEKRKRIKNKTRSVEYEGSYITDSKQLHTSAPEYFEKY